MKPRTATLWILFIVAIGLLLSEIAELDRSVPSSVEANEAELQLRELLRQGDATAPIN